MKIFIAFSPLKTRSSRKSYQLQCRVCTFLKSSLKTLCYDRHDPKDSILVIQYIIKNRKSHSNNARSVPQISKEVCNMFALFCSIQLGFISIWKCSCKMMILSKGKITVKCTFCRCSVLKCHIPHYVLLTFNPTNGEK